MLFFLVAQSTRRILASVNFILISVCFSYDLSNKKEENIKEEKLKTRKITALLRGKSVVHWQLVSILRSKSCLLAKLYPVLLKQY